MTPLPSPPSGVLFDLDGTLLDSAPGAYAALKAYGARIDIAVPSFATVREVVSRGASAVLKTVWPDADAASLAEHSPRFLALYATVMGEMSAPFDGVDELLDALEAKHIPWGIVTNKPGFLTRPLLQHLGLLERAASVVSGDTLPVRKPDPATVLHACREAGITPAQSIFVGDDPRDIQAGRDAGLYTIAAAWGYLGGADPHSWGADRVLDQPDQLTRLLGLDIPV